MWPRRHLIHWYFPQLGYTTAVTFCFQWWTLVCMTCVRTCILQIAFYGRILGGFHIWGQLLTFNVHWTVHKKFKFKFKFTFKFKFFFFSFRLIWRLLSLTLDRIGTKRQHGTFSADFKVYQYFPSSLISCGVNDKAKLEYTEACMQKSRPIIYRKIAGNPVFICSYLCRN
jgi:hypothetical protein